MGDNNVFHYPSPYFHFPLYPFPVSFSFIFTINPYNHYYCAKCLGELLNKSICGDKTASDSSIWPHYKMALDLRTDKLCLLQES